MVLMTKWVMHINFMKGVEQVFVQIIKLWERASIISRNGTWKTEHIRGGRGHYEETLIQIKGTVQYLSKKYVMMQ